MISIKTQTRSTIGKSMAGWAARGCFGTLDARLYPDASVEVDPELEMYRMGRFVELPGVGFWAPSSSGSPVGATPMVVAPQRGFLRAARFRQPHPGRGRLPSSPARATCPAARWDGSRIGRRWLRGGFPLPASEGRRFWPEYRRERRSSMSSVGRGRPGEDSGPGALPERLPGRRGEGPWIRADRIRALAGSRCHPE